MGDKPGKMARAKRPAVLLLALLMAALAACGDARQVKEDENVNQARDTAAEPDARQMPDWAESAVMYEVNIRQYTKEGTFRAFADHLPRLKEMGVDILWFMPIHPISEKNRLGTLGSYYAVRDYKAVNPEFGTAEDFRELVSKAHDMGFKVILDWVANHTGWDNPWIDNTDWYTTDDSGRIVHPPGTNWQDVADLNYGNPDMRAAMIDAMKYWVEEFDVDGFRADYAGGVPTDFWETARAELETIKPVFMLAEDDAQISLLRRAFDANYGWELYHLMNGLARGQRKPEQVALYAKRLEKKYPAGTFPLHFTSNHDENSWTGTEYERLGGAVKAMAALTFTVPGMPLIYSGQEAGLNKRLQFFEKDEIPWDDLSLQSFYRDLIRLKHDNPALRNGAAGGEFQALEADDPNILAFARTKEDNTLLVVMNLSDGSVQGSVRTAMSAGTYRSFPQEDEIEIGDRLAVELDPWEYRIFVK